MLFRKINKPEKENIKPVMNTPRELPNEVIDNELKCAIGYTENHVYLPNGTVAMMPNKGILNTFNTVDLALNIPSYYHDNIDEDRRLMQYYDNTLYNIFIRSCVQPFIMAYKSLLNSLILNARDMVNEYTDNSVEEDSKMYLNYDCIPDDIKIIGLSFYSIQDLIYDGNCSPLLIQSDSIYGIVNSDVYNVSSKIYYYLLESINKIISIYAYKYPDKVDEELYNIITSKFNNIFSLFMVYSMQEVITLTMNIHSVYSELYENYNPKVYKDKIDEISRNYLNE